MAGGAGRATGTFPSLGNFGSLGNLDLSNFGTQVGSMLQMLAGTREGFLSKQRNNADLVASCHEARGIDLLPGEKIVVSIWDETQSEETLVPVGSVCVIKSVNLDGSLRLRLEVVQEATLRREVRCELRLPLHTLMAPDESCLLYQTWVLLDTVGLEDSWACASIADHRCSFEHKFLDAPNNLYQPRICLTVCRAEQCSTVPLRGDDATETRVTYWSALLRSQQQHVVLSSALHLQSSSRGARVDDNRAEELRSTLRQQAAVIEDLRRQLRNTGFTGAAGTGGTSKAGSSESSADALELSRTLRCKDTLEATREVQRGFPKGVSLVADERIGTVIAEINKVQAEASAKIDAANSRVNSLASDCESMRRDAERLKTEAQVLRAQHQEIQFEVAQLAEQKEALLRIVEDLHKTCIFAGSPTVC